MKQPSHHDGHELATATASPIGEQDQDRRNAGNDQCVTPSLSGRLAEEGPPEQVDDIGGESPEDKQPEIHFGIPEDPSEEKDRPGDVPKDHRSVSNPIESRIGQSIGNDVFLAGNVLEPVGHGRKQPPHFEIQRLQSGVLDPISAF